MKVLQVYLRLYAECLRRALAAIGKSPWTLLLPGVVLLGREASGLLAARLGVLGGIVVALASAALFSSYLYFVGDLVQGGRVSLREMGRSFGAYLWSIVNVFFVFWIASMVVTLLVARNPNAVAVLYALWIVALVALNAVPEVLYLRGTYGGVQTIVTSWDFLKVQWIPWFAVNVPLLALVALVAAVIPLPFADAFVAGAVLHVVMVFRGHLFRALSGSSHRQRMYQQRVA